MKTERLEKLNACAEAVKWVAQQKSAAQAWRDCSRGDWMLWLLGRRSGKPGSAARKKLVLCSCACARLALQYVRAGEDRPRLALEKAEAYARGEAVTIASLRAAAAYAASADAAAAAAYAAAYAASAYATAAYAAYASAAAAAAAYAASDAASAYAADAAAYARAKILATSADIVRTHYPKAPKIGRP